MIVLHLAFLCAVFKLKWEPGACYNSGGWYDDYYYEDVDDDSHEVCDWVEIQGYAIYGHNDVTMVDSTIDECKSACLAASTWACHSFDFNTNTRSCFLTSATKDSPNYGVHENSIHFEKQCRSVSHHDSPELELDPGELSVPGKTVLLDGHCFIQYGPIAKEQLVNTYPEEKADIHAAAHGNITRIEIQCYSQLVRLQFTYGNNSGRICCGGSFDDYSTNTFEIALDTDEFITSIKGQSDRLFSAVTFLTNKNRTFGPFCDSGYNGKEFEVNGKGKALSHVSMALSLYGYPTGPGLINFYFRC